MTNCLSALPTFVSGRRELQSGNVTPTHDRGQNAVELVKVTPTVHKRLIKMSAITSQHHYGDIMDRLYAICVTGYIINVTHNSDVMTVSHKLVQLCFHNDTEQH